MLSFKDLDKIPYIVSKKKLQKIFIGLGFLHFVIFGLCIFYFISKEEIETKISTTRLEGYECSNLAVVSVKQPLIENWNNDFNWEHYSLDSELGSYPNRQHTSATFEWKNCYHESYETCKISKKESCKSIVSNPSKFKIVNNVCAISFTEFDSCWNPPPNQMRMFRIEETDINKCQEVFNDFCEEDLPNLFCDPWLNEIPPYLCSKVKDINIISSIAQSFALTEMLFCALTIIIAYYYKFKNRNNNNNEENDIEKENELNVV